MSKKRFNLMVDPNLKESFGSTVKKMGLTPTAAITLFMQQVVNQKKIPFTPKYKDDQFKN